MHPYQEEIFEMNKICTGTTRFHLILIYGTKQFRSTFELAPQLRGLWCGSYIAAAVSWFSVLGFVAPLLYVYKSKRNKDIISFAHQITVPVMCSVTNMLRAYQITLPYKWIHISTGDCDQDDAISSCAVCIWYSLTESNSSNRETKWNSRACRNWRLQYRGRRLVL